MQTPVVALLVGCCFGLPGLQAQSPRGDDKPVGTAQGFALRVVGVGNQYQTVRFKPSTGESWQLQEVQWVKIEEVAAPRAGDFDIVLIPSRSLLAVRFDRAGGGTWLIRGQKWIPIKEPRPNPLAPAKPGPGYEVRHVRQGDQLHIVRFHTTTGMAWHLKGSTMEFEPLTESGPVPAGEYEVSVIAGEESWMAFRLDRKSGKT
jgi:hypothetical protein